MQGEAVWATHRVRKNFENGKKQSNAVITYRGADKSLVRPGRKQSTATED
jgi:hypothetical protein